MAVVMLLAVVVVVHAVAVVVLLVVVIVVLHGCMGLTIHSRAFGKPPAKGNGFEHFGL